MTHELIRLADGDCLIAPRIVLQARVERRGLRQELAGIQQDLLLLGLAVAGLDQQVSQTGLAQAILALLAPQVHLHFQVARVRQPGADRRITPISLSIVTATFSSLRSRAFSTTLTACSLIFSSRAWDDSLISFCQAL